MARKKFRAQRPPSRADGGERVGGEREAEHGGERAVEPPRHAERDEQERHRHEQDRGHRDPRSRGALPVHDGEDAQAAARVVLAQIEGDGEEVRELPGEEEREQREPARVEAAGHRRPAHERRDRSGDGADEEREGRALLHRRVDRDVGDERDERERRGERVRDEREHREREHRDHDPERERGERVDAAGGQGTIARAPHEGVDVPLEPAVERVRRADHRRGREDRQGRAGGADVAGREREAARARHDDEPGEARLGEEEEVLRGV